MRNRLLAMCCLLALSIPGRSADPVATPAPQSKTATSRVVQVTVYSNSALITREVDVPEAMGTVELVVNPLPPLTVNSSLYSEGTDGIRVLTTRFRTRPIKEDTREEVRKMEDQIKAIQLANQRIQAEIKTVEQNMQMLSKLENFTAATTTHATEKGTLNGDQVITLAKYVMEQRAEKSKEMVTLQQQLLEKNEQMEFLQRQLREVTAGTTKTERDAVIVVDKTNKAAGKVRLNYLVEAASWRPQYKLRAGKDEKDPVQLEYLAAIVQQTGEDWNNVKLILSTAQPMLNATPPDLKMLQVTVMSRGGAIPQQAAVPNPPGQSGGNNFTAAAVANQPAMEVQQQAKELRVKAQQDYNAKKETSGSLLINDAAAVEQAWELSNPLAGLMNKGNPLAGSNREGPSVTYHLTTHLTVPSRNDEQILEVTKLEMTPEYFYKAVPVLTQHVYRQANLTNKSKYVLLPGEGTMYEGADFVGRMNLPLVAIGEQFTVGFGVDPQLQVQRVLLDKSRSSQGGNQVLKYDYRILISSYKAEAVNVQVWDRLPHAEAEAVAVNLLKTTPEVSKDSMYLREHRPHNLLRWDLKVDPVMNGEKALAVNYEFKLELDKQMTIGSFSTK